MSDDDETFEAGGYTLHRRREFVWELPKQGDMRVPARVLASRDLLEEISEDRTIEQLQNTTHLPGVTDYAICMPDGHQGYGFPVGGVAAIDAEDGCISPGAVGYDINCLPKDTEVTLSFGRRAPIETLDRRFEDEQAVVATGEDRVNSQIQLFTESKPTEVFRVTTTDGDTVRATADHPFMTPDGMVELDELDTGDTVLTSGFVGVVDEQPEEFTLLDESDFEDENHQLVSHLTEQDLLPLRSTDDAFARLLKLVGFHTGDGSFSGAQSWFYADREDLEAIRDDISALGFSPSPVYERERDHQVNETEFSRTEHSVKVGARGFNKLLTKLGAPRGPKVESGFTTPAYFDRLTDWQRALYLSAYFGAEMSAPSAQHDKNLYCPKVSQNRERAVADAGEQFMHEVADALDSLGIETNTVERFEADSRDGVERLRVGIKNDSENLIQFFSTVGYRYNEHKQQEAAAAMQYLKRKEHTIERRAEIAAEVATRADGGTPVSTLRAEYDINDRFIERSAWSGRSGRPRPPADFPDYEEFRTEVSVRPDNTVQTAIEQIELAGAEPVYDIGVEHDAHNFIADGFVVSNCGVRMMRTNLTYDDIEGREEELTNALFDAVPTGLGGGGVIDGSRESIDAALEYGVEWALEEGWAIESDLTHCEDGGRRLDADPSAVSKRAKDRAMNQMGSLGSGNHFLEVQRVTDIFDTDTADAYGLSEEQVVVLIHCGSRGLGHQTCNDYLRRIEEEHDDLLAQLPDRELAAAPAGSDLAEEYYGAMCACINFAWVNRQLIMHRTREVFADVFDRSWREMEMELLYDVAHNIAKREVHQTSAGETELFVHRKGATRAFPAGHPEVPTAYRDTGQPVIIPGSMGAGSYVLSGGDHSLSETFGSTAHGAGRLMSRTQAKDEFWGGDVQDDLRDQQKVYVKASSGATIAEEAPGVYKDIDEVVRISDALGIGDKVARTFPVCNIKG